LLGYPTEGGSGRAILRGGGREPDEDEAVTLGCYKLKMQQHALKMSVETLGEEHPYTAMEAAKLATLYAEMDQGNDAHALTSMALRICNGELHKYHDAGSEAAALKLKEFENAFLTASCSPVDLLVLLEQAQEKLSKEQLPITQAIKSIFSTMAILETTGQFVIARCG